MLSIQTGSNVGHHEVTHCHFLGWPDHGVPQYATSLISFIHHVRKLKRESAPPLLVHCSAGVGRSGTFILLDSMLDRLEYENSLNVYEFLCRMRCRRVSMVQTVVGVILAKTANLVRVSYRITGKRGFLTVPSALPIVFKWMIIVHNKITFSHAVKQSYYKPPKK